MAFDTQRAARRLTDAGLDARAAQGVADVVDSATSGLATEATVLALREDLLSFRAELKADILSFRAELREDLLSFRAELREDLLSFRAELKGDIHSLRAEMYRTIWMQGAGIIAATAAIVGIAAAVG